MIQKILCLLFVFGLLTIRSNCQGVTGTRNFTEGPNKTRPLLVGHRGGFDGNLPENSISLFDFTYSQINRKPLAVEFDIRKSASGSLYLIHDSTIDRTTNGTGTLTHLTDAYLESLFLKDKEGHLTTEKIPLFADVLKHFRGKNILLMLDVKGDILPDVINAARSMEMESHCILLTFNQKNLLQAKAYTSQMMISALVVSESDLALIHAAGIPKEQLIIYISEKTPASVLETLRRESMIIMTDMSEGLRNNAKAYDPDFYRNKVATLNLGVLITDYPVKAAQAFDFAKP